MPSRLSGPVVTCGGLRIILCPFILSFLSRVFICLLHVMLPSFPSPGTCHSICVVLFAPQHGFLSESGLIAKNHGKLLGQVPKYQAATCFNRITRKSSLRKGLTVISLHLLHQRKRHNCIKTCKLHCMRQYAECLYSAHTIQSFSVVVHLAVLKVKWLPHMSSCYTFGAAASCLSSRSWYMHFWVILFHTLCLAFTHAGLKIYEECT